MGRGGAVEEFATKRHGVGLTDGRGDHAGHRTAAGRGGPIATQRSQFRPGTPSDFGGGPFRYGRLNVGSWFSPDLTWIASLEWAAVYQPNSRSSSDSSSSSLASFGQ